MMVHQSRPDSCLAAVLAKLVGESEDYVFEFFQHYDPPFCDEDAFIFLAHHGIYLACAVIFEKPMRLESDARFDIEFNFKSRIAYMVVQSERSEELTHAVLWDGKRVLDPMHNNPQPLENYIVERFYPLMQSEIRHRKRFKNGT